MLDIQITDPRAPAEPTWFEAMVDGLVKPHLVDERDVIFTRLIANFFAMVVPFSIAMFFVPSWVVLVAGVPYIAWLFAGFGGPIVLGLHAVTHRPLFKRSHRVLDRLITHVMPVFVGLPPFAYKSHHVRMHHKMENTEDDLSSTVAYQRDSFVHFVHYWIRFAVFGYLHLGSWLIRGGKSKLAWQMLAGDALVFVGLFALTWLNPLAMAFVFWIPFTMLRFFLMAGNWTEHAFVDVNNPGDYYRNSTNLLNTPYNHRAYNAGYHLIHHMVPGLHWCETPAHFEKVLPELIERECIVFNGVRNNQQIWWKLMTKDYAFLADHLVDIGGRWNSQEEKIAFLKSRTQPTAGSRKGMVELRERRGLTAAAS